MGLLMRVGLRVRDRLLMVLRNRHIGVAVCVVHVGRSWRSCINRVTGLRMEVGLVRGLHDWGLNLRLLLELLERLSLGLWASGRCASGQKRLGVGKGWGSVAWCLSNEIVVLVVLHFDRGTLFLDSYI